MYSVCGIMGDVPEDKVICKGPRVVNKRNLQKKRANLRHHYGLIDHTFSRDTEAGLKVDLVLVQMDSSPIKNSEVERKRGNRDLMQPSYRIQEEILDHCQMSLLKFEWLPTLAPTLRAVT
jgi:hypothetical protein